MKITRHIDKIDFFHECKEPCSIVYPKDMTEFFIKNLDNSSINDGLKVRQILYDILISIMEENNISLHPKNLSPCVSNAIHYIKKNLSIELSLNQIAEHIFVSKSTLTKQFRKELSMSVHDYICDSVLFEACQLLTKNTLSISAISEKLGFCDQFYFSRMFSEKFGIPPRDYRKLTDM